MEVPIINRISDFDVGINSINDPSVLSRAFAISGVGKLHQAYSFWKWGALLLLAFFASFTSLTTRIKTLVFRLRNVNESLPSSTHLCDYESDSNWSFSSDSSDDDEDDKDDDNDKEDNSVNGDLRVKRFGYYHDNNDKGLDGNIPWMRRCSGSSFGDLLDLGSSGVVKLWDNLDFNKEGSHRNAVASFFSKCGSYSLLSPAVLLAAEKNGSDAVEVSAWDARAGFGVPALLADWKQPGRLLGKIIRVDAGDVDKIYVGDDDVGGEVTVGDMRMANGALTEVTESEVERMVRRRGRRF